MCWGVGGGRGDVGRGTRGVVKCAGVWGMSKERCVGSGDHWRSVGKCMG